MDISVPATPAVADLNGGTAAIPGALTLPDALSHAAIRPRHRSSHRAIPWRYPAAVAAVAAGWGAAVYASSRLHPGTLVHRTALFAHLLSLVVGLGAVVALDAYGAGCLIGRRSPVAVARLAGSLDVLIWGGLAGLLISGALLHPFMSSPLMPIKLAAVLAAGLNGINAYGLRTAVAALPEGTTLRELPRGLLLRLAATATVSQGAWWIAVLIGYWNNN
jgi:hypothetical protein